MTASPERPAQDLVADILAAAGGDGAGAVVAVEDVSEANLRWAVSMATTNGDVRQRSVTVTALADVAGGLAAASRSGPASQWPRLLAEAQVEARAGTPATEASDLPPCEADASFDLSPAAPAAPVVPPGLGEAFADASLELFGYAEHNVSTFYVGTSTGGRWRSVDETYRFEMCAKSPDRTRSGWRGAAGQTPADVDVAAALAEVIEGVARQGTRAEVPAEPMDVILTPSAVADLMLCLKWSANARDAAEGRSALTGDGPAGTALGRRLAERDLTLRSDPAAPGLTCAERVWTPSSSPGMTLFDSGAPIPAVDWIASGELAALASTRAAARELGLPFTPPAGNLLLRDAAGTGTLADLVARTERALLITSLWYIRDVDPQTLLVTGLTRDGTYLVEDGRITGATGNFRFNDSPLSLLGRIADAGEPVRCLPREWADYFQRTEMPPLRVRRFGLSTPSSAV